MGQKVSPIGMRVGVIKGWQSNWYADKDFAKFLAEDNNIRKYLNKELKDAIISNIDPPIENIAASNINIKYIFNSFNNLAIALPKLLDFSKLLPRGPLCIF